MKITSTVPLMTLAIALAVSGCKSTHEVGVKSNYMTQWTTVNADTETTTNAAKNVLESEKLGEVQSNGTKLDGYVRGRMADHTDVEVKIKKQSDTVSQVSVSVGTMGEPEIGAELTRKIKLKAEGK